MSSKKIFLDANVIIDILTSRNSQSQKYIDQVRKLKPENIYISSLSIHIACYVLKIKANTNISRSIEEFCKSINVISLNEKYIMEALSSNFIDFEDCLQYLSAIDSGCDVILTSDVKDFSRIEGFFKRGIKITKSL